MGYLLKGFGIGSLAEACKIRRELVGKTGRGSSYWLADKHMTKLM
jgi:hypothetical protein